MLSGHEKVPAPTVDLIIESPGGIVLVERRYPPLGWALPGGFVDYGETLAHAARREALEETGLEVELLELFHCYSDPSRDARRHTITSVFLARPASPGSGDGQPRGGDDAKTAATFARDRLPDLVFDHGLILKDFFTYRTTGRRPPPER